MGNFNKVILLGNLTRDIELRHAEQIQAVANFSIAVNRQWKDQSGQTHEEATFVDCESWGRQAEVMHQYLGKGREVMIEGRLRMDRWQDKQSGANRSQARGRGGIFPIHWRSWRIGWRGRHRDHSESPSLGAGSSAPAAGVDDGDIRSDPANARTLVQAATEGWASLGP